MTLQLKLPLAALAVLALAGAGGCGGANDDTRAQTAANTATTTGGPIDTRPAESPPSGDMSAAVQSTPTTTGAPASPPMQDQSASSPVGSTPGLAATPAGQTPPSTMTTPSASSGSTAAPTVMSDGQMASLMDIADMSSVEQAREAGRKAKSSSVRDLAHQELTDYAAARSKLTAITARGSISPQTSPTADQLRASAQQAGANLRAATGPDFDKQYVDARIAAEGELLNLLDDKLVPGAQNAELRDHLQSVRSAVARHLKMAEQIQGALAK
jgi:putative membrane protein